jgi:hypothetical protein
VDSACRAHADLVAPGTTFADGTGDAPVGAWKDERGRHHVSKSYFTFDLSALSGARILQVTARGGETAATDCSKPRATELWSTDTNERPTWLRQPTERAKQAGPLNEGTCVSRVVEWDTTDAVRQAVTAGSSKTTFALRMPNHEQYDLASGRRYANDFTLEVVYNRPPNIPTDLAVDFQPCSDQVFSSNQYPQLRAHVSDPQQDAVAARFAVRDVADPAKRFELTTTRGASGSVLIAQLPGGFVVDGHTCEWTAQADDGDDLSPVSAARRFTADLTAPNAAPGVFSPQ